MPYGRKFDNWDTYTWSELVLPYIEQGDVYHGYIYINNLHWSEDYPGPNGPIGDNPKEREARHAVIPTFLCPSDGGPHTNEFASAEFGMVRGNYRACTGSGDLYGTKTDARGCPCGV